MMKLYGALILIMSLSAAGALRCYSCIATHSESCTDTPSCPDTFNRCFSMKIGGNMVTKGCHNSAACVGPIKCCEGDLCNDAATTGPSVKMMLLVSSAIMALFL
ncbi:CD59 glycoprotein-like [Gouania willdenowi]|uniref:CD59 glycoprotein-like n=1 Tax=Gouania willdenowi TaxID=441366 RepID=UPI001054FCD6|nr:CD59 glycoprotein-like [Gouania willdenowi]